MSFNFFPIGGGGGTMVETDPVYTTALATGDDVNQGVGQSAPGANIGIRSGSSGTPIVAGPGPALKVSRTLGFTVATYDLWAGFGVGGQASWEMAGGTGGGTSTTAQELQVVGVAGIATNKGTTMVGTQGP